MTTYTVWVYLVGGKKFSKVFESAQSAAEWALNATTKGIAWNQEIDGRLEGMADNLFYVIYLPHSIWKIETYKNLVKE